MLQPGYPVECLRKTDRVLFTMVVCRSTTDHLRGGPLIPAQTKTNLGSRGEHRCITVLHVCADARCAESVAANRSKAGQVLESLAGLPRAPAGFPANRPTLQ
jgi:hypothetical protein